MQIDFIKALIHIKVQELEPSTFIIYGTGEVAKYYCEEIIEKFGEQAICCFINGTYQGPKTLYGKSVLHYNELDHFTINEHKYIIATLSQSSDTMINRLLNAGVDNFNIIPPISLFNIKKLEKELDSVSDIYFYPEFSSIKKLESFIHNMELFINIEQSAIQFHFVLSKQYQRNKKGIVINTNFPEKMDRERDMVLIYDVKMINYFSNNTDVKIFCMDDEVMKLIASKMFLIIGNSCEKIKICNYYEDVSKNNFRKLRKISKKYKGATVFGSGPSLKEGVIRHQKDLQNTFNIICNNMYQLKEVLDIIHPNMYILTDPIFIEAYNTARLGNLINYIKEHECVLGVSIDWLRMLVMRYGISENKLIGFTKIRDEIVFPTEDRMEICVLGNVISSMGLPVAFSFYDKVYFIGCDGLSPDEKSKTDWKYQKGIDVSGIDKFSGKEGFSKSFSIQKHVLDLEKSYEKIFSYAKQENKEFYTLTHSNCKALEKHYISKLK